MEEAIVFIDGGFLSKLSKHLGNEKYISFNLINFSKRLGKKEGLFVRNAFYYTAPPFQSNPPTQEQIRRKKGYDNFVDNFKNNSFFTIKEGRVQRIINLDGKEEYNQKGVDTLIIIDLSSLPAKFPQIKTIILVACDTDFCPIISHLQNFGVDVVLYTYYERKRESKFSTSHHLIDSCKKVRYLKREDFDNSPINKKGDKK
ncbi:MAG: NYN domain-containing protein [Nanoarchaeota archaeon]